MKLLKKNILKVLYLISALLLALPSYLFIIKNKTLLDEQFEFKYLLINGKENLQAIAYLSAITLMIVIYLLILKYRRRIFGGLKDILTFVFIISCVLVFTIPFFSHDVVYYMGVGRLNSKYQQNPYYVSLKEYVENAPDNVDLKEDTVLECGYKHFWSRETVVYGPTWTIICAALSLISFGNVDVCLLIFKIANLIIHIINCYIIYKLSKRKLHVLIYGLNPFILLESIINVHNDIFMIFFILLVFYELLKKKSIIKSILFLAIATTIKYFSLLFLPFIIIYHYRNEKTSKRLLKCVEYGLIYISIVIIPYLMYFRNFGVLSGIITQQTKLSKSLATILRKYGYGEYRLVHKILIVYYFYYLIKNINLLYREKISFIKEIKQLFYYLFIFVFVLITNFQPWYILWLIPLFIWIEPKKLRLLIQITIIALYGYTVFIVYGDFWKVGANYSLALLCTIGLCAIFNNFRVYIKKYLINNKNREL